MKTISQGSWFLVMCSGYGKEGRVFLGSFKVQGSFSYSKTWLLLVRPFFFFFYPNTFNKLWKKISFEIINDIHQSNAMLVHFGQFKCHYKKKICLLLGTSLLRILDKERLEKRLCSRHCILGTHHQALQMSRAVISLITIYGMCEARQTRGLVILPSQTLWALEIIKHLERSRVPHLKIGYIEDN